MKLDIQKLSNGSHHFEYSTTQEELNLTDSVVRFGNVQVDCEVDKSEQNILVKNHTVAAFKGQCDNCLAEFERNLEDSFTLFYTTDKEVSTDDENIVHVLGSSVHEIDLNEGIRESLLLALPMRLLCRDDCKGICPGCGANLNEETCSCKREYHDPRWDALKDVFKRS